MSTRITLTALLAGALSLSTGMARADIFDANASADSFRASVYGPLPTLFDLSTGQYDVGAVLRPEKEEDLLQIYLGAILTLSLIHI